MERLHNWLIGYAKIDLVSCFTIWSSARAPTIHPPDLLGSPSDLIAFHKSLSLLTLSLSLFSKTFFSFLQWDFVHYIVHFYKSLYLHGAYNYGHNIMRIFDVLPNISVTTSEAKPDY